MKSIALAALACGLWSGSSPAEALPIARIAPAVLPVESVWYDRYGVWHANTQYPAWATRPPYHHPVYRNWSKPNYHCWASASGRVCSW